MESFVIDASGEIKCKSPRNGEDFSLQELNDAVKGYIEIVPIKRNVGPFVFQYRNKRFEIKLTKDYVMVVNAEGKFETPDFNHIATLLATASCSIMPDDWIAGNVLICASKMIK